MQFPDEWQWRHVPGADRRLPEAVCLEEQLERARLRAMVRTSGADFALGRVEQPGIMVYDARWITRADLAVESLPGQTLLCDLTSEELTEIHERWLTTGELLAVPKVVPQRLEGGRLYRIAMPPELCSYLAARERSLRNVVPGPGCPREAVWAILFGLPGAAPLQAP